MPYYWSCGMSLTWLTARGCEALCALSLQTSVGCVAQRGPRIDPCTTPASALAASSLFIRNGAFSHLVGLVHVCPLPLVHECCVYYYVITNMDVSRCHSCLCCGQSGQMQHWGEWTGQSERQCKECNLLSLWFPSLLQWLKHSRKEYCELCQHRFAFTPSKYTDGPSMTTDSSLVLMVLFLHASLPLQSTRLTCRLACLFRTSSQDWSPVLAQPSDTGSITPW